MSFDLEGLTPFKVFEPRAWQCAFLWFQVLLMKFFFGANMLTLYYRGRYTNIDFQVVIEAAKAELINFVSKDAV